jgi:hypothetical protein
LTATLAEAQACIFRAQAAKKQGNMDDYLKKLKECRTINQQAHKMARQCAQQMIPFCDNPTERFLLFRYNQNVLDTIEKDRAYLDKLTPK